MFNSILQLILMKRIGPPLKKEVRVFVGGNRNFPLHKNDFAANINRGIIIITELRRRYAIANIDNFCRHFAGA